MSKYIIIDAEAIQKRIEELKESLAISESNKDNIRASIESFEIRQLEWCLSQSTPLIPEIEKAFDAGKLDKELSLCFDNPKGRYISNLKLDI